MFVLQGGSVFVDGTMQKRNVLIGGSQVLSVDISDAQIAALDTAGLVAELFDASDCIVSPGFIDMHVHVTGGGGELGPASRVPESKVEDFVINGITTVVGVLGTDCVSRTLENLHTKVRALDKEGISAYMYTGSYRTPPVTLTGSVQRDLVLIDQVVGVGEVAISDHRGSQADIFELARIASDARVGGMVGDKAGIFYAHIGTYKTGLEPLRRLVAETALPITTLVPTHVNIRGDALLAEAADWLKMGGYADLTANEECAAQLHAWRSANVPLSRVTLSTDAYGSFPVFDSEGKVIAYSYAKPDSILKTVADLYFKYHWTWEEISPLVSTNPATLLKFTKKGSIQVGMDADVLVLRSIDSVKLEPVYVFSRGRLVKKDDWVVHGMFDS